LVFANKTANIWCSNGDKVLRLLLNNKTESGEVKRTYQNKRKWVGMRINENSWAYKQTKPSNTGE